MKRYIRDSKRLSSLDPWEVKQLGYTLVDTGYAKSPDELKSIRRKFDRMYNDVKVYRVSSDTPRLMMYEVYAKLGDE